MSAPAVVPQSPPAARVGRNRGRYVRLAVGVLLVCGSALFGARLLAAADDTVAVWAARTHLPAGTVVEAADLVVRQVGFADQADANRYLSATAPPPAGARLSRPIGAGELLPRGAVARTAAGPTVEVPVAADPAAVPADLEVGEAVEVWVIPAGPAGSAPDRALLVFRGATVVSTGTAETGLSVAGERQVLLGLGPGAAAQLDQALGVLATGEVVLVRRAT